MRILSVFVNIFMYVFLSVWFVTISINFPDFQNYSQYIVFYEEADKFRDYIIFDNLLKALNYINADARALYFVSWMALSISIFLLLKHHNVYYWKSAFYFSLLNPATLLMLQWPRYAIASSIVIHLYRVPYIKLFLILFAVFMTHAVAGVLSIIKVFQQVFETYKNTWGNLKVVILVFLSIFFIISYYFEFIYTMLDLYIGRGEKINRLLYVSLMSILMIFISRKRKIEKFSEYSFIIVISIISLYIAHASRFIITFLPLFIIFASQYRVFGFKKYLLYASMSSSMLFSFLIAVLGLYNYGGL